MKSLAFSLLRTVLDDPGATSQSDLPRLSEYLHSHCFDIPRNWFDNHYTTTFVLGALKTLDITGQETETKSNGKMAVVTSEKGVVTADHETCSEIGADVLRRLGGTAVDAAVAVAFSFGV
ncbi:hypothetical protein DY000_02027541 [Brassica cretica]|uniref:Uncharacterized protein n=1 Tax=Brassica cretica TaxID=69181 RepID=A0ABQ7EI17_BRACR|nr:hypothetical protein DY000_02027541 [Brassica cretica]